MSYTRSIIVSGVVLSGLFTYLFFDSIFDGAPLGANCPLFLISLSAILLPLAIKNKLPRRRHSLWFVFAAFILSTLTVLRDSEFLTGLNCAVALFLILTASISMQGFRVLTSGIAQYIQALAAGIESITIKPWQFFFNLLNYNDLLQPKAREVVGGALRGTAIALPLVLIFGGLFISADAAFAGMVERSLQIDIEGLSRHLLILCLSLWAIIGFLHGMFTGKGYDHIDWGEEKEAEAHPFKLGLVEVSTVLTLINLLFGAFIYVQFTYLFGGTSTLMETSNLTLAEYARRGFFELAAVVALTLPTLMLLDWSFKKGSRIEAITFSSQALVNVAFTLVIMLSACKRMQLYQMEYGQTELRFYVYSFMIWLAVVFAIFTATVLRGKRPRFALATIISGYLAVISLNLVNPDNLIARVNLERARSGKSIDLDYLLSLSADAAPSLVAQARTKEQSNLKSRILSALRSRKKSPEKDWRSFNLSRNEAESALDKLRQIRTD